MNQQVLDNFGLRHYTYINQIFGDQNLREDIELRLFPKESKLRRTVQVLADPEQFDPSSIHWLGKNLKTGEPWCSVNEDIQDPDKHLNDTLCQSYSLMWFLGREEELRKGCKDEDQIENQMEIIKMYEDIIDHKEFTTSLGELFYEGQGPSGWHNFTKPNTPLLYNRHLTPETNITNLIKNIKKTLNDWKKYGYTYFVGKGECVKRKASAEGEPTGKRRRRGGVVGAGTRRVSGRRGGRKSKRR